MIVLVIFISFLIHSQLHEVREGQEALHAVDAVVLQEEVGQRWQASDGRGVDNVVVVEIERGDGSAPFQIALWGKNELNVGERIGS